MSIARVAVSACICAALSGAAGCAEQTREATGGPTPVDPSSSLFRWQVAPLEQTVSRGESAIYTITIKSKRNINARVRLSAEGATGATVTFSPEIIPDTGTQATMSVQTGPNTSLQRLDIIVHVDEEGQDPDRGQFVTLTVAGDTPDFALDVHPLDFPLGPAEPHRIVGARLRSLNGFAGDVTLSFSSPSPAISAPELPATLHVRPGLDGDLGFVVYYQSGPASSPVHAVLTATSGNVTHTQELTITVNGATTPGT